MISPTVRRGESEPKGSWKTTPRSRRSGRSSARVRRSRGRPAKRDRAGTMEELKQRAAERRLAGAGLADDAEGLAAADIERNVIDGDEIRCARLKQAARQPKGNADVAGLEQHGGIIGGGRLATGRLGGDQVAGVGLAGTGKDIGPRRRSRRACRRA